MKYQEYRTYLEDELIMLEEWFKNRRNDYSLNLSTLKEYINEELMIELSYSDKFMYEPSIDEFEAEIKPGHKWRERQQMAAIIAKESAYELGFTNDVESTISYECLLTMGILIGYDTFKELYESNITEKGDGIWYFLAMKFGVSSVMIEDYFTHRDKFAFDVNTPKLWCTKTFYKDIRLYTTDNNIRQRNSRIEKYNKLVGLE